MRIAFVNQFFWPDNAATSQLLYDVAIEGARGTAVSVLCGPTSYAATAAVRPLASVQVHRVKSLQFGHRKLTKMRSYASFFLCVAVMSMFGPRPDVTVTLTTPPLLGLVGWIAQKRGSRHFIWEMDLYPDVAVELGAFTRGGVVDRVVGWLADFPRRSADGIIALGPCMRARLIRRGLGDVPIHVIHNWADGDAIKPFPFARDGRLKVFYSGNMGLAHDFETVIPALIELDSGFRFRFSGGGPQRNAVSKALASFDHCEFEGYHERSDLGEVFGANDVGLVTQRAETVGTLVPSKFYGILAAGRGVLYVGPRDSTIGAAISEYGIGWQVANGDVDGLKRLLWQLRLEPEMVEETGRRARVVFERNFSKVGQVNKILRILQGERFVDRDVVVDRHL